MPSYLCQAVLGHRDRGPRAGRGWHREPDGRGDPSRPLVRILIADDHSVARLGIRCVLEAEPEFSVVGEATDGEEAIRMVCKLLPDVIVLDICMPGLNGVEVSRRIGSARLGVRILVLTGYDTQCDTPSLQRLGVAGYLSKAAPPRDLVAAVRAVAAGRTSYPADGIVRDAGPELPTTRELEVLRLVALGYRNRDIADHLHTSERTARFHISNLFAKLGVCSRTQLLHEARERGWIP